MLAPWKKSYGQPKQHIKKQRHYFPDKGLYSQSYDLSSSHVWMWDLDYEESWALKNWCFWTVGLEKTLESPLDCKEIQPVNPKGNQSWIFIGKTDAEAETPVFWPPDGKDLTHLKRPWCWERLKVGGERRTKDEMVGWHHRLNGYERKWKWSRSVMSDSLPPHGLWPTRLLCPWSSPGKNTGVDCHFLLQGNFLTQGSNPRLLHYRQIFTVWATREGP